MQIPFKLFPFQQKAFDEIMEKTVQCSSCKEDFKMLNVSTRFLHLRYGGVAPIYFCKPCRQIRELNKDKSNK